MRRIAFFTMVALAGGCAGGPRGVAEIQRTRLSGQLPALPPMVAAAQHADLLGTYRVCVDLGSGAVQQVEPLSGITGADEAIVAALRTWTWLIEAPLKGPQRLCFVERLRFPLVRGLPPAEPPAMSYRLREGATLPPGKTFSFHRQRSLAPSPALPDDLRLRLAGRPLSYQVCVDGATGQVLRATAAPGMPEADALVTAALLGWRYDVTWPEALAELCFREDLRPDGAQGR